MNRIKNSTSHRFQARCARLMLAAGLILTSARGVMASTILLGSNAMLPNDRVQLVATDGTVTGVLAPQNASAAALDGSGDLFVALPGDTSSTIQEFNPVMNLVNSFTFAAPADPRPFGSYIVDLGWGMSSLWASTFTGMVYRLSSTGSVQSSFDTGVTAPGVTTDGSSVYTTSGLGLLAAAPFLYQRTTSGSITNTIDTGLNDTLGVGFDSSSSSFWIGGIDVLTQVSGQGATLQQFALDGEHTGVEAVTFQPAAEVPEPGSLVLAGLGVVLLLARRYRTTGPRQY